MINFEERLKEEKEQLSERIVKLISFIETNPEYNQISKEHQNLLLHQRDTMLEYSNILKLRLDLLK